MGVCTILHGYGEPRGMPAGRQFASGSSFDLPVFISASAHGSMTTLLAGFEALG